MNRNVSVGILVGGGALLASAVIFRPVHPASDAPPSEADRPHLEIPSGHGYVPPAPSPPPAPRPPAMLAAKAAEWRHRADGDAAVIERLGERLLGSKGAPEICEIIAFVLGSLNDTRASGILRRALVEGSGASRVSILLALTLDRDGPIEEIFWRPDAPGVIRTDSGCRIRLRRILHDPDLRGRVEICLFDPDAEVRGTAFRALEGSVHFEDVRLALMRALEDEGDPAVLELVAYALARWAGEAQAEDPMKRKIISALLDRADDESVRHGSRAGLKRADLTADERVRIMVIGGEWADDVLGIKEP